jgi:hypothetical protein
MKKKILLFTLSAFALFSCSKDVVDSPVNEGKVEVKAIVMDGGTVTTKASSEAGSTSGAGLYNDGAAVTVTATPNAGYELEHFSSSDGKYSGSNSYSLKAYPVTFTAKFKKVYKVNYYFESSDPNAGAVSRSVLSFDDPQEIASGVTITSTAKPGYKPAGWIIDLPDGINRIDQEIPAWFSTVNGLSEVVTLNDVTWYDMGRDVNTDAFPQEWMDNTYFPDGTKFRALYTVDSGSGSGSDTYYSVTVKGDCWYNNAWWGPAYSSNQTPYTSISIDGISGSGYTTSVTQFLKSGTLCKINAENPYGYNVGETGYSFDGFYSPDRSICYLSTNGTNSSGSYSFTVTKSITIYANFSYNRADEWGH